MSASPAPFRTKKAIKEAMSVGSRWTMEHQDTGLARTLTIVRASSTSRWARFDNSTAARAFRLPVNDTKDWQVTPEGYTDTLTGDRFRLIAPAPATIDQAYYDRLALPRNTRAGQCSDCSGTVPALAGHIRLGREGWEVLHGYGECVTAAIRAMSTGSNGSGGVLVSPAT